MVSFLGRQMAYATIGIAVLCLLFAATYQHQSQPHPTPRSNCQDPYNQPGYIYRGHTPTEIRWIPYEDEDLQGRQVELINELKPPAAKLAKAPPSFNQWIKDSGNLQDAPELDFARGKTVLSVGDSHDRRNVEGFCAQHKDSGAVLTSKGAHVATRCTLPGLNLTVGSWFHYGLAEQKEQWYGPHLTPAENNPPPFFVEERMGDVFEPDLAEIGKPDLIILQSIYWDLRYFPYHATHYGWTWELQRVTRPMTWNELAWHRARLTDYVRLFQKRFPDVPIMFRLGQERANNQGGGNVALYQMNESAKTLMNYLGIPIFPWAELLTGEEDYADVMHVKPLSQPTYLFADMVLYYLRKAVQGWEMTC
ncbi:hypothetical protein BCR35DRAFT_304158 [Leucosporidium creatinivorum]|uniref:Uncharacterized protein n=1 Tax=Leucosporidium creatinivorum TaxID=106004 RepID=A0A1Y2FBI8_9BASI|nr:hypothetical protein BCR35DRAFT_304158 [Leucosporidium creatinivorum]